MVQRISWTDRVRNVVQRISWTDRVRNEELQTVKEERNILHKIKRKKTKWFNIFLTVHLRLILAGNQLDTQFLL